MRERVYKSPLSWKKEMLKTEICLITKFKTWTWNAAKRFSKGAHYYTVKSAYISLEINLVLFLCISYLAERVCSCAPLDIEESIGGNVGSRMTWWFQTSNAVTRG